MNLSKVFHLQLRRITAAGFACMAKGATLFIYAATVFTSAMAQRQGNTPAIARTPSVAWTFSVPTPIVSSPVIADGLVFFGAEDSTWYALELATGKLKWKLPTRAPIRATPLVYQGQIFLAGGNGVLASADERTGAVSWRIVFDQTAQFMGERSYDFADYYHSSPAMDNGILYLASGNGVIGAYRSTTGELLWRYQFNDIIHGTPLIVGDKVVVGCFDGSVYALNKANGLPAWKFKTAGHRYFPKGEVQGVLSTDGRRIFVGSRDYNFYAIDANSGQAAWTHVYPNGWAMSSVVSDTVVFIGTSDDRVVVAADTRSGHEYWRTDVKFNIFGAGAAASGDVIFGTIWGKAYALDRNTGKITWTFATEGYRSHHLTYFDDKDTFRQDIGSILRSPYSWINAEHRMGGIFSTPAVSKDLIVLTTTDGRVYALKR
jgi:outer membrane protein assembly factor BamB